MQWFELKKFMFLTSTFFCAIAGAVATSSNSAAAVCRMVLLYIYVMSIYCLHYEYFQLALRDTTAYAICFFRLLSNLKHVVVSLWDVWVGVMVVVGCGDDGG